MPKQRESPQPFRAFELRNTLEILNPGSLCRVQERGQAGGKGLGIEGAIGL